ncbi:alpha-ketoacid dehydrogenase subunit beta [Cryptosporangium phraense]|uniref:Alpha-ketoacid dehydrogenase subunit beta n=1 Tax=Cryptosporangium phraense TaxID=2593070 RepID=A0A545AXS5_9ACTN|nr:alpha-ketoacid dehydrogenase subunit beta [Cryptosporangium phraense]TQS46137.1 alpha-ketoacid dehydrogenase subunit beta [Cryptosporangium phraense]
MTREISMGQAIHEALFEEMERDDTVFFFGEDVGEAGGVFGETQGMQQKFGAKRVFDTPIAESMIVGAAVGAAITGLRPIVELQFADFVSVAMDEIYNKAAKWRYMHGGLFTVPLVIFAAEGAAGGAGPEHSQCPEALFYSAFGLQVVTPSTPADAKGLLKSAIRSDNPVLFLEHKALANTSGEVPSGEHLVPLGVADVKRSGSDVTIVAWSNMVLRALEAASELAADGISVEVVDPRGINPLDMDTILASVRKTGRVVLAHEAAVTGGPASEVLARITEQAWDWLQSPVKRVGAPDIPMPQSIALEQRVVPGTSDIVAAVKEII